MNKMSLRLRFGIYFGLPQTVFSLLLIIGVYAVLYFFYFSLKDELISSLLEDKQEIFLLASDYTGMQSIEFLKVNGQSMSIISTLIHKYQAGQLRVKNSLSRASTINGIVFETNHSFNTSYVYDKRPTWYLNNYTDSEHDLIYQQDAKQDLHMSKVLNSVLNPYLNTQKYSKFYVGYSSELYFNGPTNYTFGVYRNDTCSSTSAYKYPDECGCSYNVTCSEWYSIAYNSILDYPILSYPIYDLYQEIPEQLICQGFQEDNEYRCSVCMVFNLTDLLGEKFSDFSMSDITYITDTSGDVIYRYDTYVGNKSIMYYEYKDDQNTQFAVDFKNRILPLFGLEYAEFSKYTSSHGATNLIRTYPLIISNSTIPHFYTLAMIIPEAVIMKHLEEADRYLEDLLYFQGIIYMAILALCHLLTFIITYYIAVLLSAQYDDLIHKLKDIEKGVYTESENRWSYSCREINEIYKVFNNLAVIYRLNDSRQFECIQNAIELYTRAKVLFHSVENGLALYYTHYHLGLAYMQIMDYKLAAIEFEECLSLGNKEVHDKISLYRVCTGLIIAYTKLKDIDKVMILFRIIYDKLEAENAEKEVYNFLLVECYCKIKSLFPVRDILSIVKSGIQNLDDISLQLYYYYKAKYRISEGMHKSALKALVKSLHNVAHFDPVCRRKILRLIMTIYDYYGLDMTWPARYLISMSPSKLNIILFSTLSVRRSRIHQEFIQGIMTYLYASDIFTLLLNSRALHRNMPFHINVEYLDLYEDDKHTALYDGIAHSTRFLSFKSIDVSNWIIILSDKMEKGSSKSLSILERLSDKRAVNYIIVSKHEIYGSEKFLHNSPRCIIQNDLDNVNVPEILYWMFCMRSKKDVFITEKTLYNNHLLI